MASSTVENYLKQLYLEQQRAPGRLVPMGQLAQAMNVAPGTATSMIKTLADAQLVDYEPRTGVRLAAGGEQLALHVLRRHRLVELFLVQVLGLNWSEVHEEAEALEHVISDRLLERIDEFLDRPRQDPHGDPIPSAQGKMERKPMASLAESPEGSPRCIARVLDQDPVFLKFAEQHGLVPGQPVTVERRDATADAVHLKVMDDGAVTLGLAAASKILTEPQA